VKQGEFPGLVVFLAVFLVRAVFLHLQLFPLITVPTTKSLHTKSLRFAIFWRKTVNRVIFPIIAKQVSGI